MVAPVASADIAAEPIQTVSHKEFLFPRTRCELRYLRVQFGAISDGAIDEIQLPFEALRFDRVAGMDGRAR